MVHHGRCRLKVTLHHTYVGLHMHSVVWPLHDAYMVHIKRNSVHDRSKLLVVQWLGLSVQVRVRVRAWEGKWVLLLLLLFCLKK